MKPELHDFHVQQMRAMLDHCRDFNVDHDWWDAVYDDAKTVGALMGLDIVGITFDLHCQGAGVALEGNYYHPKWHPDGPKQPSTIRKVQAYASQDAELLRIARVLYHAQRVNFYRASCSFSQRSHYNSMRFEWSHSWEIYTNSRAIAGEDDMEKAINDFADWVYNNLDREYDHLTSDEAVLETIQANGYGNDMLET